MNEKMIVIKTIVYAPVDIVWKLYTESKHVIHWNNASEDWHTPKAESDLRVGGHFVYRMEAKEGNSGFDFKGIYSMVKKHQRIEYTIEGGRKVHVEFEEEGDKTQVTVAFEPEEVNSHEMQRVGWQSILDNFKRYVEKTFSSSLATR